MNKKSSNLRPLITIIIISLMITGYISCIVNFISCDFREPFKAETFYGIGIFTGLGIILGWFNFGK
jgi:hypothetical protein